MKQFCTYYSMFNKPKQICENKNKHVQYTKKNARNTFMQKLRKKCANRIEQILCTCVICVICIFPPFADIQGPAGAGAAWIMPGSKKSSGETVLDALTPPHPAVNSGTAASRAKYKKIQLNLTCLV